MITKENLYYSNDHEWVRVEGNKAVIGITDYAQRALGNIVYVELPEVEQEYKAGDIFCVIESVKAASDSFAPVSGMIVKINEDLEDSPELLNESPYDNWICVIEMGDTSELENLMDENAYIAFCEKE